jgi:hypothetical protein
MPTNRFERHPVATLVLLLLVLVPVTDLAFTALWRVRHPEGPSGLRVRHPVYHHGFKPLSHTDEERWGPWVSSYSIDSLGFRDRTPRVVPLRGTRPRLLLIGDSFTEGIGVPYEATFAGRLEDALAPSGWDVLNAGTASYCPMLDERRVRQLLDDGLVFDELAVFIDIGDIQDEVTYKADADGNVISREKRRLEEERANRRYDGAVARLYPLQRFLEQHTLLMGRLYHLLVMEPRRGRARRASLWTTDPQMMAAYGAEGLQRAQEDMDRLASELAARRIKLTVVVYPWPDQLVLGDRDSLQDRTWREWSARHGARFVSLFPEFFALGEPRDVVRRFYIPGDIHWDAEGHRVVAEAFLKQWKASH